MSRHVPRHERWSRLGPKEYQSADAAVRFEKGAWWAVVTYQQRDSAPQADVPPDWQHRSDRLGPFKRPRNAMIAAEEHVTLLQRKHGDRVVLTAPGG